MSQRNFKEGIEAFFKNMAGSKTEIFGLPEKWEFDNPSNRVKKGFWIWSMTKFQRMPTPKEVDEYPDEWISDMQLAMDMYMFNTNTSPIVKMFEEYMAHTSKDNLKANDKDTIIK